jgi:hypothetical protein
MSAVIAILSYHGWEIDPERLAGDVRQLRADGWRDVALQDLAPILHGRSAAGRLFHVTIDDGAVADSDCVAALRLVGSSASLFLPLGAMTDAEVAVHRTLVGRTDVAVEDHSLRHSRAFHYRHVVAFHNADHPLMSSPERLGLQPGDPVCTYGGELVRPRFFPDVRAVAACRETVETMRAGADPRPESFTALANVLVERRLASWRFGKLCVAGAYETRSAFAARLSAYLQEGFERLRDFTGRTPRAFAHPWWQASAAADRCLRDLGYSLTFSGRGLCRGSQQFAIPRLPVNNSTPRPLNPTALAAGESDVPAMTNRVRALGRRLVFA